MPHTEKTILKLVKTQDIYLDCRMITSRQRRGFFDVTVKLSIGDEDKVFKCTTQINTFSEDIRAIENLDKRDIAIFKLVSDQILPEINDWLLNTDEE